MNGQKNVTIKDIAKLAGVNHSTVSRVLNNNVNFPITDECREKILSISKKLDYIPSSTGRALRSGKSCLAGYLTNSVATSFYADILQGAGLAATRNGFGLLTALVQEDVPSTIESALRMFKEKGIDYLIISALSEEVWKKYIAEEINGLPVVLCSADYPNSDITCVMNDDIQGGKIAAEHLIANGHRKLGFFYLSKLINYASLALERRIDGFVTTVIEAGLPEPQIISSKKELKTLIDTGSFPSAFFCYSDGYAIEAKRVIQKAGFSVPGDISLIGLDDNFFAGFPEFELTTIAPAKKEIGAKTIQAGINLLNGKKVKKIYLPPKLVCRKSVRNIH